MLKDLISLSDRLDSLGLTKEADFIDSILYKKSSEDSPGGSQWEWEEPPDERYLWLFSKRLKQIVSDIFDAVNKETNTIEEVIAENKEAYLRIAKKAGISEKEAMKILNEEIKKSNLPTKKPEPPIDHNVFAKTFEDYVLDKLDESIKVTDISWRDTPASAGYLINSEEVLYRRKTLNKKKYYDEIYLLDENSSVPINEFEIKGKDGNMYYFDAGYRIFKRVEEKETGR